MINKYEVLKITPSACKVKNRPTYDYSLNFNSWEQLTKTINGMGEWENGLFCGRGSIIKKDGKIIGNVCDFYRHEKAINRITLTEFLALGNPALWLNENLG